ncbi:MAG: GAF domain-containing protein [Anaerolineae bacterium]|nr:GAF domain-containing protein [Anaerolineae bacterium]
MSRFIIRLIQNHIDATALIVSAIGRHLTSYTLSIARDLTEAINEPIEASVVLLNFDQFSDEIITDLSRLKHQYKDASIILLVNSTALDSDQEERLIEALDHGVNDCFHLTQSGLLLLGRQVAQQHQSWVQHQDPTILSTTELINRAIINDKSDMAIQFIGADRKIRGWNNAAETFFGIKQKDALGQTVDTLPLSADDLNRLKDIIDQAQTTQIPFFISVMPLEGRRSTPMWVNVHVYPIFSDLCQTSAEALPDVCLVTTPTTNFDNLERSTIQHNQDLQLLQETNRQISSELELQPTLVKAVEQTKYLLDGDNCQIYLLEKDNKTLRPAIVLGPLANPIRAMPLRLDREPISSLVSASRAALWRAFDLGDLSPYPANYYLLAAPLTALKGTIGLIIVSRQYAFTQDDRFFFESLVQQASSAINNARLFEETQRSLKELAILYEASQAISTHWNDQDVLNTLIRHTVQALDVSRGFIISWDKGQNKSYIQAEFINYAKSPLKPPKVSRIVELTERAALITLIDQKRPVFLYLNNPSLDAVEQKEMQRYDCKVRLLLPLVAKGQTVGWVELWETEQDRHFNADEVRLARTLSSQIAVALQNIRYLEQTQRTLEETTALYRVASALTTPQDPQAIISTVLQEFLQALSFRQGSVIVFDYGIKAGIVKAHIHDDLPIRPPQAAQFNQAKMTTTKHRVQEGYQIPLQNNPVYERLMRTNQPVIIDNPKADWLTHPPSFLPDLFIPPVGGWGDEQAFNILIVPIRIREEIIGVLVAENTRHNRNFDQTDISTGQAMADQLGVGLQNVRLYESEYRRREQAETLREVAAVVSSSLNLNEVLERILDQLGRVVQYDSAAIHLIEGNERRVIAGRGFTRLEDHIGLTFPVHIGSENEPGAMAIQTRQPLIFSDISGSSASFRESRHSHIRSWMGIPLIARDKAIGLISIDNSNIDAYTEEDLEMALAFANQVAVTLENARLYEIEVRELERELNIAHEIQETLLPQFIPQIPGLDIAGRIEPARQVGGDFFHFFSTQDEELGVAIGDVSGKGIPAALYMAAGITAIDTQTGPGVTPGELLNKLNAKLYNRLRENRMNIALQIATFVPLPPESENLNEKPDEELARGSLMTAASAGMIAPIGATVNGCTYLPVGGLPVGALPASQYTYQDDMFLLDPFTTIIFTSDGIVEAQNNQGELFGFERLEKTILDIVHTRDAQEIADYIIDAAQTFTGESEQHDDMTVVVVVKK